MEAEAKKLWRTRMWALFAALVVAATPVFFVSIIRDREIIPRWSSIESEALIAAGTLAFLAASEVFLNRRLSRDTAGGLSLVSLAVGALAIGTGAIGLANGDTTDGSWVFLPITVAAIAGAYLNSGNYRQQLIRAAQR